MSLEKIETFISKEGNIYSIIFNSFDQAKLPLEFEKPLIEVTIAVENYKSLNGAKTLGKIVDIIKIYLDENDVILYSYCDNKEINRSINNQKLFPQHYRSLLFATLFHKYNTFNHINEVIVIADPDYGHHYIHLISRSENRGLLDSLTSALINFGK